MPSVRSRIVNGCLRLKRGLSPEPAEGLDVARERAELAALARALGLRVSADREAVDSGGVPAEWVLPRSVDKAEAAGQTILFLHGGSFNSGSPAVHRPVAADVAAAARSRVLVVDYRLAPEHPYPAAPEDAMAAYRWLLAQGTRPEDIVLLGDSAGGTLVLNLLLALRDSGSPLPAGAVCLSPCTDLALTGESWSSRAGRDVILERRKVERSVEIYLRGADPSSPLVSPLYAELGGLPPLLVQVGSEEVLLADSERLARKARAAGVAVELEIWEGMQHEWHFTAGFVPEARQALARIGDFALSLRRKVSAEPGLDPASPQP
ncbi:MAG: alpha/beta hydrolase [Spirochaetaceae bacterium]|nr:alpha/beta hydrolase [Spirochaetaceae bacterium]